MSLRQISINEIIPKNVIASITEKVHVDGNVSESEVEIIARIVAHIKPKTVFEFGTFDGRTTINIAINAPEDAKIYTLDLPASQIDSTKYKLATVGEYSDLNYVRKFESGIRYREKEGAEKIVQLFGDSAKFDYSPYAGIMNLIFVDGSHVKEYTQNDTEAALLMIKLGGVILWHDYASVWPDVTTVLEGYESKGLNIVHIEGSTLAYLRR